MKKKWNYNSCQEEAKKFKSKMEWIKKSKGSYEVSRLNGWIAQFTTHMVKEISPTKICNECHIEKKRSHFNKDYAVTNGLRSRCKDCQAIQNAKYRKIQDKHLKKIYMKEYAIKNRDAINERERNYRKQNPEKIRARAREENRKKFLKLEYKLAHNLRSRLNTALKRSYKKGSAVGLLGSSIEELKKYLESKFDKNMSWANWGVHGWHIDHIKPLSSFDLQNLEDLKKACHYTNLQPLWASDNLKKYNKVGV